MQTKENCCLKGYRVYYGMQVERKLWVRVERIWGLHKFYYKMLSASGNNKGGRGSKVERGAKMEKNRRREG